MARTFKDCFTLREVADFYSVMVNSVWRTAVRKAITGELRKSPSTGRMVRTFTPDELVALHPGKAGRPPKRRKPPKASRDLTSPRTGQRERGGALKPATYAQRDPTKGTKRKDRTKAG